MLLPELLWQLMYSCVADVVLTESSVEPCSNASKYIDAGLDAAFAPALRPWTNKSVPQLYVGTTPAFEIK